MPHVARQVLLGICGAVLGLVVATFVFAVIMEVLGSLVTDAQTVGEIEEQSRLIPFVATLAHIVITIAFTIWGFRGFPLRKK